MIRRPQGKPPIRYAASSNLDQETRSPRQYAAMVSMLPTLRQIHMSVGWRYRRRNGPNTQSSEQNMHDLIDGMAAQGPTGCDRKPSRKTWP